MLIVDAQIHIWKISKPNPNHRQIADYSADDALKEMDEAGVTAAVIHPPGWDPPNDGTANGSAGVNSVPDLGGRRDSTGNRQLAEHLSLLGPNPPSIGLTDPRASKGYPARIK